LYAENKISDNILLFSNKTADDIIYESELLKMLGTAAKFILTRQRNNSHENSRVDEGFLKNHITDFSRHFYVCGPDPMVDEIVGTLGKLGASVDSLVFEK
jgi:hypothetical protein